MQAKGRRGRPTREERIERWREGVRDDIVSCMYCQPWEGGPVWVIGHHTDVWDVLISNGVPDDDEIRDEVVQDLTCPRCGADIGLGDDVGIKFKFEIDYDITLERAERRFGPKLKSFAKFLESYPMLGAVHPVGRRILKEIEQFPKTTLEQATWYRARRIDGGRAFTPDDMRLPEPDAVLSPGRFNHLGQAHWYLSESDYSAVTEVLEPTETMAWLQKWTVNEIEPVLNLVRFGPDDPFPHFSPNIEDLPLLAVAMVFGGHLNRNADRRKGWKPEYFIPHYVADAAKRAGFRGIRFTSTRSVGDVNLVIFDKDAPVNADGEPFILNVNESDRGFNAPPMRSKPKRR